MRDQHWETMQRVFTAALELRDEARDEFLDEQCAGDLPLREQIDALLAAHERSSTFLEDPNASEAETMLHDLAGPAAHGPRPEVPGFRIVRELGRGGMGIVYEAERLHPRQTVALKVLKPSFAQPNLRRRFEHEIHLLARLKHPGIAQIYDAGVAPSPMGPLPYFAMELVEGRPLDAVARDSAVSLRQRLTLIAQIADAVQHAHQKAIIHRDLKPNNILVTAEGEPKILDFGVARALDPELQLTTMQTELGQLVGTLPYMSPEQAAGSLDQLDTRSDVYSLGVVAYELLAGRPPYDLTEKLIPEAVRVIREEEPGRLSTIDRTYRGDIETIVAKALEKHRDRRYQSVADFGADIRRFLSDEPIVARPPSRVYLVRKFAKRHRSLVASTAVALVLLIVGAAVSTTLALRLAESNTELSDTVTELADARDAAQRQADTARAVNQFYTDHLLLAAAPEESLGQEITIRQALDDASIRVDTELSAFPEAASQVHKALSSVFRRLDEPDKALEHGALMLEAHKRAFGEHHAETYHAMINYAQLLHDNARYEESEPLRDRGIQGLRETNGEDDVYFLAALAGKAAALVYAQDPEPAIPILQTVIAGYERITDTRGEVHPQHLLAARASLANCYDLMGRSEDAEATLRAAVEDAEKDLDPDHPILLGALNSLGATYMRRGDHEAALPITQQLVEAATRVLGPEHVNTLIARQNLARTLSALDRFDEAEPIWLETLPLIQSKLPNPHPLRANITQSYGIALAEHGRPDEAIPFLLDGHTQFVATLGKEHPGAKLSARWLANIYEKAGNIHEAERWQQEAGD